MTIDQAGEVQVADVLLSDRQTVQPRLSPIWDIKVSEQASMEQASMVHPVTTDDGHVACQGLEITWELLLPPHEEKRARRSTPLLLLPE